jgi:hypothetical protein
LGFSYRRNNILSFFNIKRAYWIFVVLIILSRNLAKNREEIILIYHKNRDYAISVH